MESEADTLAAGRGRPRTVVRTRFICADCGNTSAFDGVSGEWCAICETDEHLVRAETLYRLVEIGPISSCE